MAQIVPRPRTDGGITYQVRWRQNGAWESVVAGVRVGERLERVVVHAAGEPRAERTHVRGVDTDGAGGQTGAGDVLGVRGRRCRGVSQGRDRHRCGPVGGRSMSGTGSSSVYGNNPGCGLP